MAKLSKEDFADPSFEDIKGLFEDIDFNDTQIPDDWFNPEVPADLAQLIAVKFPDEQLEALAEAAVQATVEDIPAKADPQTIAKLAVERALGLAELPELTDSETLGGAEAQND